MGLPEITSRQAAAAGTGIPASALEQRRQSRRCRRLAGYYLLSGTPAARAVTIAVAGGPFHHLHAKCHVTAQLPEQGRTCGVLTRKLHDASY